MTHRNNMSCSLPKLLWCIVSALSLLTFQPHPGSATDTVTIAVIGPKTGKLAYISTGLFQSATYTIEELNKKGGILGKQIAGVQIDNKSTSLGSAEAARRAVEMKANCVIGPMVSSLATVQAEILQEANIPMLTPTATAPSVTQAGDYVFRLSFTDTFQGRALAHFAGSQLNAKRAAILMQADELYSLSLSESFAQSLRNYEGEVVYRNSYRARDTDYSKQLEEIKELNIDVIFIPGFAPEAARIIDQARESEIYVPVLGGDGWSKRLKEFSSNPSNLDNCYEIRHFSRNTSNDVTRSFLKGYEELYGVIQQDAAALTHDAFVAYKKAVEKAGSFDRKKVRDALYEITFQGATGNIRFNDLGDPEKSAAIITYRGGEPVYFMVLEPWSDG